MITLSVIVACHDVGPYVRDTVRSVLANLPDLDAASQLEIILVDDASTDGTAEVLAAAAASDPRVIMVGHLANRGISAARNSGLEVARGTWLAFLDGDDVVLPGYYAQLVKVAEELDVDLVKTDHVQVTGRDRTTHRVSFGPRHRATDPRRGILPTHRATAVDYPFVWAGVYHRRLLDAGLLHFDESLQTCEDRLLTWRLHLHARSFAVVGLAGVYYRRAVPTSLTQIVDHRQFDFLPAFASIIAEVAADHEADLLLPKAMRSFAAVLCHHLRRADRFSAAVHRDLRRRAAAFLDELDPARVQRMITELDPERQRMLRDLPTTRRRAA